MAVKLTTGRFIGNYSRGDEFIYKDVGKVLNDSKINTLEIFDTCAEVCQIFSFKNGLFKNERFSEKTLFMCLFKNFYKKGNSKNIFSKILL